MVPRERNTIGTVRIVEKKKKEQQELPEEGAKEREDPPKEEAPKEEPQKAPAKEQKEQEKKAGREAELLAQAEDYKRKWYSVTAEYENYRKRTAGESARRYLEGRADVVKGLFPIADNLERALQSCADEGTKKGIQMVIASFENLLKEEKIEAIDPLGQPFDADVCEAIMAVEPEEGEESGTVKQVYQKGYKRDGKVLRFAQVVVIK